MVPSKLRKKETPVCYGGGNYWFSNVVSCFWKKVGGGERAAENQKGTGGGGPIRERFGRFFANNRRRYSGERRGGTY